MAKAQAGTTQELERLVGWRRDLHRIPEVGFEVAQTLAYVRGQLEAIGGWELEEPAPSSLTAFLDRGGSSAVAVRAELDALPVHEETGEPWASRHEGRMHACGHDAHMAMALGLAARLSRRADEVRPGEKRRPEDARPEGARRNVLLVFEPAEETTGGARDILASGTLAAHGADRIVGLHMWPGLPAGVVAGRAGAQLASSNEVDATFFGKATHIATASEGADALEAAAAFLTHIYEIVSGTYETPDGPAAGEDLARRVLLKFGRLSGGEVRNQIAAQAKAEGSLRTFDEGTRAQLKRLIADVAAGCAKGCGCTSETGYSTGYPVLVNDAALFSEASDALDIQPLAEPLLISDDFAWYGQELPGLFLMLGTGRDEPLHASTFCLDERAMADGVDVLETLVDLP
jgi:amidohydrolase